MLTTNKAATIFAELGHPARLQILRCAIEYGKTGVSVGEIQAQLNIPASTLSHHIARMVKVGLIHQSREKQTLFCSADFNVIRSVIDYLEKDCCSKES